MNLATACPLSRANHRPVVAWKLHCPDCGCDCIRSRCPHTSSLVADVPVPAVVDAALEFLARSPGFRGKG